MENRYYKVNRNDVYVGRIIKFDPLENPFYEYKTPSEVCPTGTKVHYCKIYRSMLFAPTRDGYAEDLLYTSPLYPAVNIASDYDCKKAYKNVIVTECCHLAKLLEYLGYQEVLSFEDLMRLRNTVFKKNWIRENMQLFGMQECKPLEDNFDTEEAFRKALESFQLDQKLGLYSYSPIDGVKPDLPNEYFYIIDDLRDAHIQEILIARFFGINLKANSFKSSKDEVGVKRFNIKPVKRP